MNTEIRNSLKQRRLQLGLTQREVAKRGGIEQRQVSGFERGRDVTLTTLLKLVAALETELLPVPREAASRVRLAISQAATASPTAPSPSLLDLYGVSDDDEEKRP
jgi:transcriptional regulator with XRE-family HTH domain